MEEEEISTEVFNYTSDSYENGSRNISHAEYELPLYLLLYVALANALIFIVGIIGNLMVLTVIIRQRDMRTHMNYLLASLCVADLQVLIICQPIGLIEFYGKDRWYLGEAMCK